MWNILCETGRLRKVRGIWKGSRRLLIKSWLIGSGRLLIDNRLLIWGSRLNIGYRLRWRIRHLIMRL